tara:strand:+ start:389 stop:1738 length:1350 start_codon:yes stop_codon:yes gene_type:complete
MFLSNNDPRFKLIQKAFAASTGVTTDTRQTSNGKLFFALRGENFDGNQYAQLAIEHGCCGAVIDDAQILLKIPDAILVDDVLLALQSLARWHRRKWDCPVIGLTGSNGKTTTKELLKIVCQSKFPDVQATAGNLNNEIGVPLTLLSVDKNPDMVIVEMGANAQGEIALLASISEPTHGIITNIGRAHLDGFGGIQGVIKGKSELFDFFRNQNERREADGAALFVNANHPILLEKSDSLPRITYGTRNHPPFVSSSSNDASFTWVDLNKTEQGPLRCHISGVHNFENMMTAVAVGIHFGVSSENCSQALMSYAPNNNRSQWIRTDANEVLLDAYNANPSSMESALNFFGEAADIEGDNTSLVAILGDMGELGSFAAVAHNEIVQKALEMGVRVITVGPLFHLSASQIPGILSFETTQELGRHLALHPITGKKILLKGSRSIALEEVIGAL